MRQDLKTVRRVRLLFETLVQAMTEPAALLRTVCVVNVSDQLKSDSFCSEPDGLVK